MRGDTVAREPITPVRGERIWERMKSLFSYKGCRRETRQGGAKDRRISFAIDSLVPKGKVLTLKKAR